MIRTKLNVNTEKCYGCRFCELACSYHHGGVFSPELSSIRISKSNRTGKIEWRIDSTCDSCEVEEQPLCVRYCFYGALKEVK